jgi:predicted TIM-barrel fold metal-dependent hydrolase
MPIVDCHLHFFSRDFFVAMARQKDPAANIDQVLHDLAQRTKLEIPPNEILAHLQRWLTELDRHGVERAVAFASLPEEATAVAEAVKQSNGRLIGFCVVNPAAEGALHRVHKLAHECGYRGVMLFPALHHFHVSDVSLLPFFEAVAECRMHALTHFGILQVKLRDALGLSRIYDSRFSNPLDLQTVANRFPRINFILPHFGGGFFRETLMLGLQCENVYVDTSSSNNWMITQPYPLTLVEVFQKTRAVFGMERILFGTDSGAFPRGWRRDLLEAQKAAMIGAGFSPAEMKKFWGECVAVFQVRKSLPFNGPTGKQANGQQTKTLFRCSSYAFARSGRCGSKSGRRCHPRLFKKSMISW